MKKKADELGKSDNPVILEGSPEGSSSLWWDRYVTKIHFKLGIKQ